jgi:hypothetical protein
MSNYKCLVKIKKTGKIIEVSAFDDFFDGQKYAYVDGKEVYSDDEVEEIK